MSAAPDSAAQSSRVVLRAENLRVSFSGRAVVHGIDLHVGAGETLAIVGESGSGKSVTARALLALTGPGSAVTADRLEIDSRDLSSASSSQWRSVRGASVGLVSQDALVSLDPLRPIGREIADALRLHTRMSGAERSARVLDVLREVGLPEPELRRAQRSGELSGGQRQRALIASAIALRPPLLIADEPTTALDVTVQARILALLAEIRGRGTGLLLISHDLAVVAGIADRVAVMSRGRIVETGPVREVLEDPQVDETKKLLAAVPAGRPRGTRLSGPPPAARSQSISPPLAASPPARPDGTTPALEVRSVTKTYSRRGAGDLVAVDDVSLVLEAGTTLGLVGESGSGKSTLARIALALTAPDSGDVLVEGTAWSALRERDRRPRRRVMGAIYQDAVSSFDPRLTVQQILADALRGTDAPSSASGSPSESRRIGELLDSVGLPAGVLERRPARLSGGQRQRVSIARALAAAPRILICDEPVSALDVGVQATVLDLLDDLQRERGLALLFISHDLGVIRHVSDTVAVMQHGRIVESGPAEQVFRAPSHPYTRTLLDATPTLGRS